MKNSTSVTIIVPVYGDWLSLNDCIQSLMEHVDTGMHRVMLVNDCGPEADVIEQNIRVLIKSKTGFQYFRNKKNLGFVGNCNNAVMNLDKTQNDILLLNSDTKVTEGFVDEMRAVLYSKNSFGVVSPRSNNATICTFPLFSIQGERLPADTSYEYFDKYHMKLPRYNIAPTGHGFCILIRRSLIHEFGLFDTAFGKGYGEEVDFCRRVGKHGWKSVIANHAYVFHIEARSFSLETKAKLIEKSKKIIEKRYPEYKQEVTLYIREALELESKILGLRGRFKMPGPARDRIKRAINKLRIKN